MEELQKPILIVEDDPLQQHMLSTLLLRKLDYPSYCASNGREALQYLANNGADSVALIVLDLNLPGMSGLDVLKAVRPNAPSLPVLIVTGSKSSEDAVNALQSGASDYITKPYDTQRLLVTIGNLLRAHRLEEEIKELKNNNKTNISFEKLIGYQDGLKDAVQTAQKAAQTDIPVLITGETGTGKEVFAKALHGQSERASAPFIAVNCGALPELLIESILFGHEKGAFTGATRQTIGKFREAAGGTIFLDEIGDLPLEAQVKLLRVLQEREVEPVGATRSVPVDVRILSATNRDLAKDVQAGRFREDLYYRLNTIEINLPPLRERPQDIVHLADQFIKNFIARQGGDIKQIKAKTAQKLSHYPWPGNVRELENSINRAMVLDEDNMLDEGDFDRIFESEITVTNEASQPAPAVIHRPEDFSLLDAVGQIKPLETLEQEILQKALEQTGGNTTRAAKALGIAKSTFYRKMKD